MYEDFVNQRISIKLQDSDVPRLEELQDKLGKLRLGPGWRIEELAPMYIGADTENTIYLYYSEKYHTVSPNYIFVDDKEYIPSVTLDEFVGKPINIDEKEFVMVLE